MQRLIFVIVVGLGGAALLAALGLWQLQRLSWKEDLLARIDARIGAAPADLPQIPTPQADQYLPVAVSGRVNGPELHVLVSQRTTGAGFRIVTAFETDTGRRILLDSGFVPDEAKLNTRPPQQLDIVGNLLWPDERDRFTPENDPAANYWFARDIEEMSRALDTEPVLLVARETTPPLAGVDPLPVGPEGIPNNHLGYAVQWFGMAIVWLGMTALMIRRISRRAKTETDAY